MVVSAFPVTSQTFILNHINSLLVAGHNVKILSYNKGDGDLKGLYDFNLDKKIKFYRKKPKSVLKRIIFLIQWFAINRRQADWNKVWEVLNFYKYGREALSLDLFFKSQWFLQKEKFDIIHAHFGNIGQRIAFLKKLGLINSGSLICTFHGYDLRPNRTNNYLQEYKDLLSNCDVFTVNSSYLKNILKKLNYTHKNIFVLPVGLNTSFYQRRSQISSENFQLMFCGRLIELKGPDLAVEILMTLRKRGFNHLNLVIIGEGRMKERIEKLIKENELNPWVKIMGSQSPESVKNELEKSKIFLLPGIKDPRNGRAEAQGLVIQEAQSMEVPVIVSDVGGMKEGLIHGRTGFVVKEKDIEGFADKIEFLIKNEELRVAMGTAGREFAVNNFDLKVIQSELDKIYTEILK